MDDQNRPTGAESNPPGAPELGKGVAPPSAPLIDDKFTGPVFRAEPINPERPTIPEPTDPAPQTDNKVEVDDAEPEVDGRQARMDYLQSLRQDGGNKRKKGKGKIILIVVIIVLLLGAGGAAAYMWLKGSDSAGKTKQPSQTKTQTTTQPSTEPVVDGEQNSAAEAKTFTSTAFALSIAYPGDWTPEELKDKLVITSPVVTLTDANGQKTNGRMVLNVRARQDKPVEFTAGNVVAVLDSDKVNYTKPSSTQRGSTYLSYLQYATTTTKGGMDGVYITGDYGYKYGQTVRLVEISKVDPLVNVMFVSCADTTCAATTQKALSVSSTAWKTDTANRTAVETMLKSLALN